MNLQKGFIELLTFIFLFAIFAGACDDSDSSSTLIERDFAADPTLTADPEDDTIIKFLEPPNTNQTTSLDFVDPEDTGGTGFDTSPFSYRRTLEHTFCWEDDDGEAGHFIELDDIDGNNIFTLEVNDECVTEIIEAGDYILKIFHDGFSGNTHPIFFIPDPDELEQAKNEDSSTALLVGKTIKILNFFPGISLEKAYAQNTTPQETLINTSKCIGCNLKNVDLSSLELQNVDLSEASLNRANLSNSDFTGSNFTSANLRGANLSNSSFKSAVFSTAILNKTVNTDTDFSCATWTDGICKCNSDVFYTASNFTNSVSVTDSSTFLDAAGPISVAGNAAGMALLPDESLLYVTNLNSQSVSLIDTSTNTKIADIPVGMQPTNIVVNPDGSKLYVANLGESTISEINTSTNTSSIFAENQNSPNSLAISPDGSRLYVHGMGDIAVFNTQTNTQTGEIFIGSGEGSIALSPDGTRLYATDVTAGTLSVINTISNMIIGTPVSLEGGLGASPTTLAVTPDSQFLYSIDNSTSSVSILDTNTLVMKGSIPVGQSPFFITISKDGTKAYVANFEDNTVSIIDTLTNTVTETVASALRPTSVALSPGISIGECVGCQ
jgi:YVTN family beta-propeller protein